MNKNNYWSLSKKEKARFVLEQLKKDYPTVETPLIHKNAFQLLVAVTLSTQTKDETTNSVTPELFAKYPDVYAFSKADPVDIEPIIRLINYYKTKAKRLVEQSKMLIEKFGGKVPSNMNDLIQLPGVGRKVANVVVSEWFAIHEGIEPEGFVVDTHVIRVSNALGLTKEKDPKKIEQDLMDLFPKEEWPGTSLRMIFHGREVFQARNPQFEKHKVWREIYNRDKR